MPPVKNLQGEPTCHHEDARQEMVRFEPPSPPFSHALAHALSGPSTVPPSSKRVFGAPPPPSHSHIEVEDTGGWTIGMEGVAVLREDDECWTLDVAATSNSEQYHGRRRRAARRGEKKSYKTTFFRGVYIPRVRCRSFMEIVVPDWRAPGPFPRVGLPEELNSSEIF
eukprot:scaffold68043_cov32-Tisochrysis_lutea.AAC.1